MSIASLQDLTNVPQDMSSFRALGNHITITKNFRALGPALIALK
jgi:hypothetical protein